MKHFHYLKLIGVITLLAVFNTSAQTPLPYSTGFDNIAQQSGWQLYRKGAASIYPWTYSSNGAYSAPNALYHDFPLMSPSTDTTQDWFVSPAFNFSAGGKIDELKIIVYTIANLTPADYFGVFLLQNSPDPALATSVTQLTDLTSYNSSGGIWTVINNISIPATVGNSYIAFKYKAVNNWFTVSVDDIQISSSVTGIKNPEKNMDVKLSPNPVNELLLVEGLNKKNYTFGIFDVTGKLMKEIPSEKYIDVSEFTNGVYFLKITDEKSNTVTKKFVKR